MVGDAVPASRKSAAPLFTAFVSRRPAAHAPLLRGARSPTAQRGWGATDLAATGGPSRGQRLSRRASESSRSSGGFRDAAYRNGVPDEEIMGHTRHRSLTTMRSYFRRAKLSKSSPAGKLGLYIYWENEAKTVSDSNELSRTSTGLEGRDRRNNLSCTQSKSGRSAPCLALDTVKLLIISDVVGSISSPLPLTRFNRGATSAGLAILECALRVG